MLRLLRYAARLALKPETVEIRGVRLGFPRDASPRVCASIYAEMYEGLERRALERLLEPGDVVVEVGAAIGYMGVAAARIVGERNVHMIEANADLLPEIEANFARNGFASPRLRHGLASHCEGSAEFRVADEFWSSSALERGKTKRVDTVPMIDVNALMREVGATVFVSDIEGGEFDLAPKLDFAGVRAAVIEQHKALDPGGGMAAIADHMRGQGFKTPEVLKGEVFVYRR